MTWKRERELELLKKFNATAAAAASGPISIFSMSLRRIF
jgi:hypothetical protein